MPAMRQILLWMAAAMMAGAMLFATQAGQASEKAVKVERDYSQIWKAPAPAQQPGKTEGEQLAAVASNSPCEW